MKKTLLFGIIILVLLGILFYVFISKRGGSPTATQPPPGASAHGTIHIPSGDTIVIGTPQGSVTMKNFYKAVLDTEEGFAILRDRSDYQIAYDTNTSRFSIAVLGAPFDEARKKAEADFLSILGITKNDACRLAVSVVSSARNSEVQAEKNMGLSFCAAGVE